MNKETLEKATVIRNKIIECDKWLKILKNEPLYIKFYTSGSDYCLDRSNNFIKEIKKETWKLILNLFVKTKKELEKEFEEL